MSLIILSMNGNPVWFDTRSGLNDIRHQQRLDEEGAVHRERLEQQALQLLGRLCQGRGHTVSLGELDPVDGRVANFCERASAGGARRADALRCVLQLEDLEIK